MIHSLSSLLSCGALFFSLLAMRAIAEPFPDPGQLPAQPGLPDPLVMLNGERVTTKQQWAERRRPELKALFERYMYGHMPPARVSFNRGKTDKNYFSGKATKKEITIVVEQAAAPKIHLLLVIPNGRNGPTPAFAGLNFCGNESAVNDPDLPLTQAWMPS